MTDAAADKNMAFSSEKLQDAPVSERIQLAAANVEEADQAKYDAAAGFLAHLATRPDAEALMADWTDEEERAIRRKLDWIVLPLVCCALTTGGIDKVILSTSATFGLRTDLNLVGQDYSWASSIIFFGAMASVFPQGWFVQRFHTGRVFAINVAGYAIFTFATIGCKNRSELWAVRFLLGLFEGLNTSGAGLVLSMWWKPEERYWRTVICFNTTSSLWNGLLSYAVQFYKPNGSLSSWQLLYLILGCFSTVLSVLCWFLLPSNPSTARWLTDRQKFIAVQRMKAGQTGMVSHKFKWSQVKEALIDFRTWLYFFISIFLNIPNGGLNGFYSIVVTGFGFSVKQTLLMNIPTGMISWFTSILWTVIAQKTRQPILCAVGACLVCLAGTIALTIVPVTNRAGMLVSLYIVEAYWAPYIVFGQLVMYCNVAGTSKKVAVFGISYIGYTVGNLVGPQSFLTREAPKYQTAYTVMLAGYCVTIALLCLYAALCWWENKKRDAKAVEAENDGSDHQLVDSEWQDLTDKQNPKFRYTW